MAYEPSTSDHCAQPAQYSDIIFMNGLVKQVSCAAGRASCSPRFLSLRGSAAQRLLPEKRMLYQPNLPKAAGSDYLAARIKQLRPMVHVFGHTHFPWDTIIDGIRYCQWPLSYPRERRWPLHAQRCLRMHAALRSRSVWAVPSPACMNASALLMSWWLFQCIASAPLS